MSRQHGYYANRSPIEALLGFEVRMACGGQLFDSLFRKLEQIPVDHPTDQVVPTGEFWIIGPASSGLCLAYQPGDGGYGLLNGEITLHHIDQLTDAGFVPIRTITVVKR